MSLENVRSTERRASSLSGLFCVSLFLLALAASSPSALADTVEHSGAIYGDETWSSADEHLVTGDVTVTAGVTLTVEPGATVLFVPLSDDTFGGADELLR